MTAKLAPALSVAFAAALLVLASATDAFAHGSRESRDSRRAMVRCARALSDAGLSYAHQVNNRVSSCVEQLRVCRDVEGRPLEWCLSISRSCSQVAGAAAAWEARLRMRVVGQCQGLALADVLGTLGYGADLESCAPSSFDGLAVCLAQRTRGATMGTMMRLHPGACELATAAGLGTVVAMDACEEDGGDPSDPPACEAPHYCGGPEGVACPIGQVCNRRDPLCGPSSVAGVCTPAPETCADEGEPVCGCDGTTYASDCHRVAVAAVLRHTGLCEESPTSCSFSDSTCPAGQFCEFPAGDCGEGQMGECQPASAEPCNLCTEFLGGAVCGCDMMTYPSDCDRRAAGVAKWMDGPCF
jgi:hypothetical protein